MRLKKYGWNRIKNELFRKGISKEILPKIEFAINIKTEEDYLIEITSKKLNSIIKKEDDIYKVKQKLFGFLVRKGFDFEDSKNVIDRITKEYQDKL